MTTEKPIPFSAPMMRAIIRGHTIHPKAGKTRTMRQYGLKNLPEDAWFIGMTHPEPGSFIYYHPLYHPGKIKRTENSVALFSVSSGPMPCGIPCPYGSPGTRLWAREGHCLEGGKVIYRATTPNFTPSIKWRPSIHMRRCHSRILLEIENITIQRPKAITWDEAVQEGVEEIYYEPITSKSLWKNYMDETKPHVLPQDSFFSLLESINGKDFLIQNPSCWTIEFKVLEVKGEKNERTDKKENAQFEND